MAVPQSGPTLIQLGELIGGLLVMGIAFHFLFDYMERYAERKEKEIEGELKEEEETGELY
ncbi:hypothetical protein [Thermococcus sp.]|uniref:hypothetical protein n=1 Tax=Thermococcus sp. TaxID=35749 RepID=UPI0026166F0E|nr:hypothetical protein [Thermococcus sp.]